MDYDQVIHTLVVHYQSTTIVYTWSLWSITRSDLLVHHLQFVSCGSPRRTSAADSSWWL
uniref:Uncharacterized protein n=1 Tax=Arundo donax TaxID=35708 RepID=A0A0A9EKK0_ARUDO